MFVLLHDRDGKPRAVNASLVESFKQTSGEDGTTIYYPSISADDIDPHLDVAESFDDVCKAFGVIEK